MSTGKKDGGKDVGDLRARLGLGIQKPSTGPQRRVPAQQAPQATPQQGTPQAQAMRGPTPNRGVRQISAEQVANLPDPIETPTPPPSQAVQSHQEYEAPAPSGGQPVGGVDFHSMAANQNPLPDPGQSPFGAPVQGFGGPSSPAFEPALAVGDATMAAIRPVNKNKKLIYSVAFAVVSVLCLLFGFQMGNVRIQRQMINQRIRDAANILARVEPVAARVMPIIRELKAAKPNVVDEELAITLGELQVNLRYEDVIGQNPLLGASLTNNLTKFVSQATDLSEKGKEHARLTLKEHKGYLDSLKEASNKLRDPSEIYVFSSGTTGDNPIAAGNIVRVSGEPYRKGRNYLVPVRTLAGEDHEATLNQLVRVDRGQLFSTSGPTVLQLYNTRIRELQQLARAMETYVDPLLNQLKRESSKPEVFSF